MVAIILFIVLIAWIISVADGMCVAANDKRRGREAFKELQEKTPARLNEYAKKNNAYYNSKYGMVEEHFNYDGTPKYPGAKPLPR